MSEKHPDFEIEPVNTIQPLEIKYTQTPQALVPIDTPLSIICKHIPRQSQHSTHFRDIYQYITDGKLPSGTKVQNCIRAEALNYVVINHFLFRIDT